ncbi:arabinogalactan oligomer/maltooligosaccharide transport system substrate-binding protein [Paenibacillus anaericanus]|uniref:sugar ABC transporter substrate-binding protein n=1 Tax=Paenibacillus anaericanus TaxID=170367 RepID=UPI0027809690|nr:maltose ABC transporter substrate-binding protein [Paenibacillus anaericanus]MDQ0089574.1 arabinogalactan oligomer/maltooligosaccharide transport system substrate-binding protein [Paenibacillus anaericanus]
MRKLRNLTLVFALVITVVLAGCGGNNNQVGNASKTTDTTQTEQTTSPEPSVNNATTTPIEPEIEKDAKLLVWDNGGSDEDWAKMVAEEFTKKYNIPVEVQVVSQGDAPTKLQTDGPALLGADVFLAPHDKIGGLISAGLVLENFYPDEYKSEFMEAAITGTSIDGVLYGYPTAIDTYALFYNKDLVKTVPATMDELIEQSKAFTDKSKEKYGFMMLVNDFYFLHAILGGYGGYVFGDKNTNSSDIGLNNEGAVQAGQFMQRLHKEVLPLSSADINAAVKETLFINNNLLFDINGPWAVAALQEAKVNFGVAPLPKLDNGKSPTSFSGIRAYYVNSYTKYPEAASLYAKFATSEEMLMKKFEISGQMPPRTLLLENEKIKDNEIIKGFLDQATVSVPMPNIPEMAPVWGAMGNAFTVIWDDNADPKETLDKAVTQINEGITLLNQ